ncbi:hypothetical protein GCM10029964_030750 [Kibdelosporangium lantanae]
MPQLIHLNGPAAVGKSTVARMYTDHHPGVLNLDIDQVVSLIGGWRENLPAILGAARALAVGMAETHLRGGYDVVMPQLVTNVEQASRFSAAASRAGGEYREIVLLADKQRIVERFTAGGTPSTPSSTTLKANGRSSRSMTT